MATITAKALPLAAATAVLTLGAYAQVKVVEADPFDTWQVVLQASVGVANVLAGLVVWIVRPETRTGPLLVAMGAFWFAGDLGFGPDTPLAAYVGFPMQGWNDVLLIVLLLHVSPGGLHGRAAKTVVGGVIASHLVFSLARLLLRPPSDISGCMCLGNRITGIVDPEAYNAVVRIASFAEAAFALAALGLLALRWRASSGPARRTLGLLLFAGVATAAIVAYNRVLNRVVTTPQQPGDVMLTLLAVVRISIPTVIAASLVRGRRARTRVADVVLSLDHGGLETAALQRALADPSVRMLRWDGEAYRTEDGTPATLPGPRDAQAATLLERDGNRLGALVHDRALREEPELLDAVAAAAKLALHNERLAAEARERLREVDASRRRIAVAGQQERRRLERDLHDGAQQRLIAITLGLRKLERKSADAGDLALADGLDALAAELGAAVAEIREIARGVRPPLLTEVGLGAALEALARRAPVPVDVDIDLPARVGDLAEETAYFVASEGLANVLKSAGAEHVRLSARAENGQVLVTVSDDGSGGAEPSAGSGLQGLADRVEATGGTFTIDSPPGGGTTLTAVIQAPVARR